MLENEICQVIEGVWNDFLEVPVERRSLPPSASGEAIALTGCVRFTGAWEGALLLQYPIELARSAAAAMFHVQPEEVTREHARDAVGELTNMVGGNLKALLPSPCQIGLPNVTEEKLNPPIVRGDRPLNQLAFQCQAQRFLVTVLEFDEAASREHGADTKRREFTRVSTRFEVELTSDSGNTCGGPLQDVSMKGLSYHCRDPFPVGTQCQAALLLGEPENPIRVEARGRVVRATDGGIAVEFAEMDVDSYRHLRNLVLHNSAETERAEAEIKNHLGLKSR